MAQPTNTFDAYDAVGTREDLQEKIYMVSPEKTPVLSMGRRFKAAQKFHEWQRDSLATPNKDNAVIEGDDRSGTALTATNRVGNYMQLFDKIAVTTSTLRKSTTAGRADEMKYQIAEKAIPELKRDIEAMLISSNVAVAGDSTTARKSAGLGRLIYTNASYGGAGATPAHTSGAATSALTAGTNRAFTETLLKTVLASIYTASGDQPDFISVTPSHKQTFSGFAGIAVNRYQVAKGQQGVIVGGADIYVGDFGELTVVPNYVQATANSDTALILNKEQYGVAYLQPIQTSPLSKTGHSDKEMVFAECAAVALAESALGKVSNLTP
jgi:hypothetical protein